MIATRNAPCGRPCFSRSDRSRRDAFSVSLINRSFPILIFRSAGGTDVVISNSRSRLLLARLTRSLLHAVAQFLRPRQWSRRVEIYPGAISPPANFLNMPLVVRAKNGWPVLLHPIL